MKYKNNILDKITQLETTASKMQIQASRGAQQDQILESIENLKEQIEKLRDIISLEQDDFSQQFSR